MGLNGHYKGVVEEVGTRARVKVRIPELDNLVTDWIPVGQALTLGARTYGVYRQGTQVAVIPGQGLEDAYVSHALYSQADPAPWEDPQLLGMEADDGTQFLYDPGTSALTIKSPKLIEIEVEKFKLTGDMEITGNTKQLGNVEQIGTWKLTGAGTITGGLALGGGMTGYQGGPVAMQASSFMFQGPVTLGALTADSATVNGTKVEAHGHISASPGTKTGPPVG